MNDFELEKIENINKLAEDLECKKISLEFLNKTFLHKYSYNFNALGRPIIQYPQDIIAMQELIWEIKPDLIIETGIAHGGSLIMNASMLAMLDICDAINSNKTFDPKFSSRKVIGVDIDIRLHNLEAIKKHPMSSRIHMIEGSSIDKDIIDKVKKEAKNYNRILVSLDSNHTHDHVLAELQAYAPLTSVGSYCVVFDTTIDDLQEKNFQDRPWGPGNNPKTAVKKFISENKEFEIDKNVQNKLMISIALDGYLKRIY
jgi:cephalosporin hydroxylase